jgi:hypothetical protein
LYAIGSQFVLTSGVGDALQFYDAAIRKSADINIPVYLSANRELGVALAYQGKFQNIPKSRDAYLSVLGLIAKKSNNLDLAQYAYDLAELANIELKNGDWKCGTDAHQLADDLYDKLITQNPQLGQIKAFFDTSASAIAKQDKQPSNGCPYVIPKIDWL